MSGKAWEGTQGRGGDELPLNGVDSLGLLKALCSSRFGPGSSLRHPKAGGCSVRNPAYQRLYLFKGRPERWLSHLRTFCRARKCCCSFLPFPAQIFAGSSRPPRARSCSLPTRQRWSEQDFRFPTSLGASGFLDCFCPNGKCIMRNCLNNSWYKETRWSKVRGWNLFPRK